MFTSHEIMTVFFKLVNFCILMGLAAYAFKKYMLPLIVDLMAKKDAEKEFLLSQQVFGDQRQYELDDIIKKDVIIGDDLKIKIDQWKRVVDHERAQEMRDDVIRISCVAQNNDKKRAFKEKQRVQEKVLKSVVEKLSSVLPHDFENRQVSDEYFDEIVAFMNKRSW